MDNDDISDITLQQLISEAIQGDEDSLGKLMGSNWMAKLLTKISAQVGHEFGIEPKFIWEPLFDALCTKIQTIENPNESNLLKCLTNWCYTTARNYCRNELRHLQVVKKHSEQITHEQSRGKRISPTGESIPLPLSASDDSPYEILLHKEGVSKLNGLRMEILKIIATLPPRDLEILLLWALGKTLKETRDETGIPLSTVQKRLKKLQRMIIERIGLKKLVDNDPKLLDCVYEFISNTLEDHLGNFPTRAA